MFILTNMGKDHEFLEAARNGNITVVEKLLNQKSKRSGPLASLRRGPGANVQDSSGYSALHHAALNGHTDVVRLLLAHDTSPNLPDTRGSSPLHLAAWAGHQDIVKLFLTQPNRPANPNLQTIENETPLHCAAQHGHTGALTTLLAHGADPNVTNNRHETPLDLAAQYGRLQAVQMLIRAHPELLLPFKLMRETSTQNDMNIGASNIHNRSNSRSSSSSASGCAGRLQSQSYNNRQYGISRNNVNTNIGQIVSHSPLHLASRNGHKNVVEVLLAAGVNVNLLTPSGTALHEAALCGKDIIVRTLLDFGADLDAKDCDGRTALDILEEFPAHVTKGIVSVINNHRNLMLYDHESDQNNKNYNITSDKITPMSLGSSYENNHHTGSSPIQNYCNSHHDITMSPSSSICSLGPPSPRPRASTGDLPEFYVTMAPIKNQIAPKKPPRRNLSVSPTQLSSPISGGGGGGENNGYGRINQYFYQTKNHIMSTSVDGSCNNSKNSSPRPAGYEYVYLAHTGPKIIDDKVNNRSHSVEHYIDMQSNFIEGQQRPTPAPRNPILPVNYENTSLKSYNPNRKLKRNRENYESFSIDFNKDKVNYDIMKNYPQSPTNYQQPPTPEHPPPPPSHAEKFIHERIRPLSQEYKRRSGLLLMMESGTSPQDGISQSLCASSGSISSSVSISDRSVSTDCVEEYIGDVPFAGLFKGSTMNLNNVNASNSVLINQYQHQNYSSSSAYQNNSFSGGYLITSGHNSNDRPKSLNQQNQEFLTQQHTGYNDHQQQQYKLSKRTQINSNNYNNYPARTQRSLSFGGTVDNDDYDGNDDYHCHYNNDITNTTHTTKSNNSDYDLCDADHLNKYYAGDNDDDNDENTDRRLLYNNDNHSSQLKKKLYYRNSTSQLPSSTIPPVNQSNKENENKENIDLMKSSESVRLIKNRPNSEEILSPFNEEEAWAKISEIMESFGSGILAGTINDKKFNELSENSVKTAVANGDNNISIDDRTKNQQRHERIDLNRILSEWNLLHLEKCLIDNGYDNTEFMNGILDESDMNAINIPINDRDKLFRLIEKLPQAKCLPILHGKNITNNNTILSVDQWLHNIELSDYTEVFRKHLYTNMESVCRVWEVELQTVLDIIKIGHRRRILHSVSSNRNHPPLKTGTTTIDELNADLNTLKANMMELNDVTKPPADSSNQVSKTSTTSATPLNRINGPPIRHSNKKNRPAPKPPIKAPLEIRAPAELLLGLPSNLRTQWRHAATTLVTGSVTYDVYYLGSTVVKELRGTESTRKSIQKLKREDRLVINDQKSLDTIQSLQENNKKRPVRLAISQRGVQFIDIEAQSTICEHEIRNINCACQDADDLSHFAYITKDTDMNTHYCHVFTVDSMDLATEIILTLGQAFEVAYQLVLRDTIQSKTPIRTKCPSGNNISIIGTKLIADGGGNSDISDGTKLISTDTNISNKNIT